MKQQQANIIEAKAAIRRADESVIQGRSIVIFTVVTIIFVSGLANPPVTRRLLTTAAPFAIHDLHLWHERKTNQQGR